VTAVAVDPRAWGERDPVPHEYINGAELRAALIRSGRLVPATSRPTLGRWHDEPATLRLLHNRAEARAVASPWWRGYETRPDRDAERGHE
jgi:hypothetical protein